MKTADKTIVDGTFVTVPRLYYQLFTVFVSVDCYIFPVFFLSDDRKSTQFVLEDLPEIARASS